MLALALGKASQVLSAVASSAAWSLAASFALAFSALAISGAKMGSSFFFLRSSLGIRCAQQDHVLSTTRRTRAEGAEGPDDGSGARACSQCIRVVVHIVLNGAVGVGVVNVVAMLLVLLLLLLLPLPLRMVLPALVDE